MSYKSPRPAGARWEKAKLYSVDLYQQQFPVCGTHLVWVLVGHKHVRCCLPVQGDKWRMHRSLWDTISKREFIPNDQQ